MHDADVDVGGLDCTSSTSSSHGHGSSSGGVISDSFLVGRLASPSNRFLTKYYYNDFVPQPLSLPSARKTTFTTLEQEKAAQLVHELTDLSILAVRASRAKNINKAAQILGMSGKE